MKVPGSVTNVKQNAFYQNYDLEYVVLPAAITELQSKSFTKMRQSGEDPMPIFYSWSLTDKTRRNISSTWKDATVQEYYLLLDGEEQQTGKHYWHYVGDVPTIIS